MPRVRAAIAFIASLFFSSALAAPFAVQVGESRIGLDAPPGFADTGFTGSPRLQELAESLTSASNRILLFALSDADLRRFTLGDPPEFRRFMLAVTPKAMERERVSRQSFEALVADSLREVGPAVPAGTPFAAYLDKQPAGRTSLLAELRREPDVVAVLLGARAAPQGRGQDKAQYLFSTSTLMLVRGKALTLSVFTDYAGPADLEWLRSITLRWIDEVQRLNNR